MDRGKNCLLEIERLQRLLLEGEARVVRQERLIAEMQQAGLDTTDAEKLLNAFRNTLGVMRQCLLTRFQRTDGFDAREQ
jgi:hypothetical protein